MIDMNLLKSKIVAVGMTQKSLAKVLGMRASTLSEKITGRSQFDIMEANLICEILGITDDTDKCRIFFGHG